MRVSVPGPTLSTWRRPLAMSYTVTLDPGCATATQRPPGLSVSGPQPLRETARGVSVDVTTLLVRVSYVVAVCASQGSIGVVRIVTLDPSGLNGPRAKGLSLPFESDAAPAGGVTIPTTGGPGTGVTA